MLIQGQVGPQVLADGTEQTLRLGKLAGLIVQELHGRYYEQAYRAGTFLGATQAAVSLSALSATATGLILTNPAGSGKNLVLLDLSIAVASASAAAATLTLAANVNVVAAAVVQTTPLIVRPALLGSAAASVALLASAATLPAVPVIIRAIGGGPVAGASTTSAFIRDEIAGSIMLAPGTAVSLSTSAAVTVLASIAWEEVLI